MPFSSTTAISSTTALAASNTSPTSNTHSIHTCTTPTSTFEYLLYLPKNYSSTTTTKLSKPLPIILFLHGADEVNKGKVLCRNANGRKSLVTDGAWRLRTVKGMLPALVDQIKDESNDKALNSDDTNFPFILISPQCPKKVRFGSSIALQDDIVNLIKTTIIPTYNGDGNNVFVTGLSMGGCGTWSIATRHSNFFKAAAPICGGYSGFKENILQLQGIWCFHGANDSVIPVTQSDVAIKQLNKAIEMQQMFGLDLLNLVPQEEEKEEKKEGTIVFKKRSPIEIKYTRYENSPSPAKNMIGHGSWIQAYFESDLLNWFEAMSQDN